MEELDDALELIVSDFYRAFDVSLDAGARMKRSIASLLRAIGAGSERLPHRLLAEAIRSGDEERARVFARAVPCWWKICQRAGDTWRHWEARFERLPWFSDLCFSMTRPLARSWPRMFSTSIGLRPEAVDSPASGHTGVDAVVISDAYHQGQRGLIHSPGPGGA